MYGTETNIDKVIVSSTFEHQYNTIKKNHFKFDLGVRLGLEFKDPCGCWNGALYWTHFISDAHGHYPKPASLTRWFTPAFGGISEGQVLLGGPAIPTGVGALGLPVQSATAKWKLRLNLIDVLIGREYRFSSCLSLKPHVGVRIGLIDQRYDVKYVANTVINGTEFPITPGQPVDKFTMKSDFEGTGPRLGLDATYDLGCGVSVFGYSAASLLWGMQDIQTKEHYVQVRQQITTPFRFEAHTSQKDYEGSCRAITDLSLGIRWLYCCCQRVVMLQLGYEQHLFFNTINFEKFTNIATLGNLATDRYPQTKHGNLCIHGLVVSAKVDF